MLLLIAVPVGAQDTSVGKGTEAKSEKQSGDVILDEVKVKGYRHKPTTIERAATTTTITDIDIEQKESKVLKDVLYLVPGFKITTERKGITSFTMRGYTMDKIAILSDGITLVDSYSGIMNIDNIGFLDVSEIIITRGSTSALFGTKGAAGSINILKEKRPSKPYAKGQAEIDHLGNHFISTNHGAAFGKFFYMLSASYDRSLGYTVSQKLTRGKKFDWIKRLSNYEMYNFTLADFEDPYKTSAAYYLNDTGKWNHVNHTRYKTNIKVGYNFTDNTEFGVGGFYNHSKMKNSAFYADARSSWSWHYTMEHNHWDTPNFAYIFRNVSNRWPQYDDYGLTPYFNIKTKTLSLKSNIFFYGQYNRFAQYMDPNEMALTSDVERADMTWSIWTNLTYGINVYPVWKLSDFQKLSFAFVLYKGQHYQDDKAFDDKAVNIIYKHGTGKYRTMDIRATYLTLAAEDELHINSYTDISLGVSYDAQDLSKFQGYDESKKEMTDVYKVEDRSMLFGTRDCFNPVAGIVSKPLKDFFKWRLAFSYKTTFPTLQMYSHVKSYSGFEGTVNTDTRIRPERSFNTNAGVEFMFFDKKLTIACDYFYSFYFDKIVRFFQARLNDVVYRNTDAAYMMGTETIINWNTFDIFGLIDTGLGFSYTFNYSRNAARIHNSQINKGKFFENLPVHKFSIDFKAMIPKTDTSFFLFGYFEYDSIFYTMKYRPEAEHEWEWSRGCFKPTHINNPLMIDAKLSQKFTFYDDYSLELYILCKNIFDDYLADPFNPGPGRTWCFGVRGTWN